MPATYTYNDAIDDALRAIAGVIEANGPDEKSMTLYVKIAGRLSELKRPTRRKRSLSPVGQTSR